MKTCRHARKDEGDFNFIPLLGPVKKDKKLGKSQTKFLFVTFMLFFLENVTTILTQCFAKYICPKKIRFSKVHFLPEEIYKILKQRYAFEKMLPKVRHNDL